jgi:GNAT superfamily N-acetyltransferase
MMIIRRAIPDDTATVRAILRNAADSLHERGYDQWPDSSPSLKHEQLLKQIGDDGTYLVTDGRDPVATIAVTSQGDADFWSPAELAESAVYISKAAIVRSRAGEGLGALLLRWLVDRISQQDVTWGRLDAWRTNLELQAYYRKQGWTYIRTVDAPHRHSGALFQKRVETDLEARAALRWKELPNPVPRLPLEIGSPVITDTPDGPISATVMKISNRDWGYEVAERGWEHSVDGPPVYYVVTRDGRSWTPPPGHLWADPIGPE